MQSMSWITGHQAVQTKVHTWYKTRYLDESPFICEMGRVEFTHLKLISTFGPEFKL